MDFLFARLLAQCGGAHAVLGGGLPVALFVAGLVASATHCAPMCGILVLGQVSDRLARVPATSLCEWQRLRTGALLPYHCGRITTYAVLGAIAGLTSGWLAGATWLRGLSAMLLGAASVAVLLQALPRRQAWAPTGIVASWSRSLARLARRFGGHGFVLGLVLGLLPCGLIYGALLAAAAAADPAASALGMAAFGLGTAPALIAVGIAGQAAGQRCRGTLRVAGPALSGLSAAILFLLAVVQARSTL